MPNFVPGSPITGTQVFKIERLAWAASLTFSAYGRRMGVRVNDARILELLPKRLPHGWRPSQAKDVERLYSLFSNGRQTDPQRRRDYVLLNGTECLAHSVDLHEILDAFERDARLFVAEHAQRRVFVHAAVLGWNGSAIVIPGKSMSGKTSLAAEFVRSGASYYSDEYAVFDRHGYVHAYAKPLSLRDVGNGYAQTDFSVEELGGRAGTRPLPVGIVLVTHYREGSRWRPQQVSAGMGVLNLLANTITARRKPEESLDILRDALHSALVVKGVRGEASEVVESALGFDYLATAGSNLHFRS